MKLSKQKYDVLSEVSDLVDRKLDLMEALAEAMKYRMNVRSRLVCRCPRCVSETEGTLTWVEDMRTTKPVAPLAEPVQPRRRMSRAYGER